MMTPEPVPWALPPATSMVTTLGWIRAAAALTVPSTFAAIGAFCVVCGRLVTVVVLPSSSAATVPAPMPPPTTAAVTAATRTVRPGRDLAGASGDGVPYGGGGSVGPNAW